MDKRTLRVMTASVMVMAMLLAGSPASAWHQWSFARENTNGPFFGARSTKTDVTPYCVGTEPVYQPLWIIHSSGNWIEAGTGHCFWSQPHWYAGYASNNNWTFIELLSAPAGQTHQMQLFRQAPCKWEFKVDATVINSNIVSWCIGGARVEAGLESYGAYSVVSAFNTWSLQVFDNVPFSWRAFSGKDAGVVTSTIMCGKWNSSTSWRAGENTTC